MALVSTLAQQLQAGQIIPYLGPEMLSLCPPAAPVPATPLALAEFISTRVSVPHKIRLRLTQAAQYVENFKHRKSLTSLMDQAFATVPEPSRLHLALAASAAPLWVDAWYDGTMATALARTRDASGWSQVQGLSQAEHFGQWTQAYSGSGQPLPAQAPLLPPLLYKPLGARRPTSNYLVSDSDYVEVLTEIDIQTPIPSAVQALRIGRSFLFVGCRFDDQLTRSFARQIMKRSSHTHWAVLPQEPTRMEARFLREQGITRIPMPLADFAAALVDALLPALAA